jgi:hypothetical protein
MGCCAHQPLLAADGGFAAFKARSLPRIEAASLNAFRDALLLDFTSLVDGGGMALHGHRRRCGCCLSKAKG